MHDLIETPKIFTRDAKGAIRFWFAEVTADGRWRGVSGHLNGFEVRPNWTVCTLRSKATLAEQAMFEANSERRKKLDHGYAETVEGIDEVSYIRPQLCESWKDYPHDFKAGFLWSQPKLDGMRSIGNTGGLWSRKGKRIVSVPHIEAVLERMFYRWPDLTTDGELYNHNYSADFEELMSLCRKSKNLTADVLAKTAAVQYHIYDLVDTSLPYTARKQRLEAYFNALKGQSSVVLVNTRPVKSHDEMMLAYRSYLDLGYEGQILRHPDQVYEQKRSQFTLKHKPLMDAEFVVEDILPGTGNWSKAAKKVIVRLANGTTSSASIDGTMTANAERLADKAKYIGGEVTIQFLGYTADGKLRGGVAKDWHPNGRND